MKLEKVLMKTNFKLSLVAVALATVGFAANAANVTPATATKVSKQGVATLTDAAFNAGTPSVVFTAKAAYSVGDTITFTFTGDSLKTAPLLVTSVAAGAPATQSQLTLGRIGQTATSATYRVTEVGTTPTGVVDAAPHGTITLAFTFDKAKVLAAGSVDVTAVSRLTGSGDVFDNASGTDKTTRTLFSVVDQTKVTAAPVINATINVSDATNPRKVFLAGAAQVATFTAAPESSLGNVNVASHTVKVDGDFSWAINPTTGYVAGSVTPACSAGAPGSLVVNASSATFVCSGVNSAVSTTASLTLDPTAYDADITKRPELSQTSYTATFTSTFAGDATQATSGINAGAWGINGSVIHVPYMVYGTVSGKAFSQIVNITNNGSKAGKVYADVWTTAADGKVTRLVNNKQIGTVEARGLYRAAGDLRTALATATTPFTDGLVQMRLTTDVSADDVTVYAAYVDNVTAERAIVNNDSPVNVRGFSQIAAANSVSNLSSAIATLQTSVDNVQTTADDIETKVDDVDSAVTDLTADLCNANATGTVDLSSIDNITVATGDSTVTGQGAANAAVSIDLCN